MSKRANSKYKIDRRLRVNLWGRPKSPINKREYGPGQHGQGRTKPTDYRLQLMAKQRLKGYYGSVGERQLRRYYLEAVRRKGDTGENLVELLERRLDAVIYRMKFAITVFASRQLVSHRHVKVNGRRVTIPSYLLRAGDVVEVQPASREIEGIKAALEGAKKRRVNSWLELDDANFKGTVRSLPSKEEMAIPVQEQLVVALYSK